MLFSEFLKETKVIDDFDNTEIDTSKQNTSGANDKQFIQVIENTFTSAIPSVKGTYVLGFTSFQFPEDKENFYTLYDKKPGGNSSSIGKGEVALYWLFNYHSKNKKRCSTGNTSSTSGESDLIIDGKNVEVKGYESTRSVQTGVMELNEYMPFVHFLFSAFRFLRKFSFLPSVNMA